ncbi:MAG: ribose 5-phosphate isomerase A [Marine Group III euryarchaeote CG-Bathy1]|uniref:Ribose-5-phosphate isomerase A n=1 Tax=Marine Group III euryarchaeote CG-Bathy1 TaxID=1889001 RepID=A0A1J5TDT1_9ARCH|nr:MAG: ribose 5-phosphate isomerase A [Marine Group III euryarchaeote CG-Bathy1]
MNIKKHLVAEAAIELLEDGMIVGLGTGSTSSIAIDLIGKRVSEGLNILGIPTSKASENQATSLGIPLTSLSSHPSIDITIDGADEVSPSLDLIKGLGGALVREKIVENQSKQLVIIIDDSKLVSQLGICPLPVEVIFFGHEATSISLANLGCNPVLRMDNEKPFISDNGNVIYHCNFAEGIADPLALSLDIDKIPGVVTSGLFVNMADVILIGSDDGLKTLKRH